MRICSEIRRSVAIMALAGALVAPLAASAHEFWIEPHSFSVEPGENIIADVKTGQMFVGDALPYIAERIEADGIRDGGEVRKLGSATGALPAIDETASTPGLALLWFYVLPSAVEHDWKSFTEFAEYEGVEFVLEQHTERGLPTDSFLEIYSRCAKALVAVGDAGGEDEAVGMPLELVAGANPYATEPGADTALPVTLLWHGAPLEGAQIRIFRDSGDVDEILLRTDAAGHAQVPIAEGGRFLLSAVHIVPTEDDPEVAWHSFWATLTFEVGAGE